MPDRTSAHLMRLSFLLLAVISTSVQAAFYDSRVEKWEFFLAPQVINSKALQFDNGSEANISKRSSLAFGFGYNLNSHIELGGRFSSSSSSMSGTIIPDDGVNTPVPFTSNLYASSLNFDFTYNILSGPFTPYITANLGTTYLDSGIPTGNIGTGCGWYFGWYYCGPVAQTFTSTEFNYGAGVGLRYDFNRKLYIKGGVAKNYIDINSSNTPDFTTYQFIFGFMF
jgi:hypothetical protein